jgi:predicted metal-dependent phosphotriesterase family hydrolase
MIRKAKLYLAMICLCALNNISIAQTGNDKKLFINTVKGKIEIEKLGFTLTHEHIMSNFGGELSARANYTKDSLYRQVIPYLRLIKSQGVRSIVDCTTAYFGRDVNILKELADSTGLQIITNTGFYGAAKDRYVPQIAYSLSEEQIAALWIAEFRNGIDGTKIKPGFVKLAFDEGEPSAIDIKLFEAGVRTHLKTGLTLAVHTGGNTKAAETQMRLLQRFGVNFTAWIWTHAHHVTNVDVLMDAARKGAWISLDGVNDQNYASYVSKLKQFQSHKLLNKVLLSHDGNSFPRGKAIRPYDAIQRLLLPELKKQGFSDSDIVQLTQENPQEAFAIRVRKR